MSTANQNTKVSLYTDRSKHEKWAEGVKIGNKKIFHPYTRKDFKFQEE